MDVFCRNEGVSPITVRVVKKLHEGAEFESIAEDCSPYVPDLPDPSNDISEQRSEVERPLVKLRPRIYRRLDRSFNLNESFSCGGLARSTLLVKEHSIKDMLSFQLPKQVNTTSASLTYGPESNGSQEVLHDPFTPIKRARAAQTWMWNSRVSGSDILEICIHMMFISFTCYGIFMQSKNRGKMLEP